MKFSTTAVALLSCASVDAFGVQPKKQINFDLKNAAAAGFAAATIASNLVAPSADAMDFNSAVFPSTVISEKVTREGMYGTYDVDLVQSVDDARSTYKPKAETKSKKGKYTALLSILVVGSFIIPMAQYLWYVKDDDSSDRFFAGQDKTPPPPPPPPKKKGWFN